MSHFKWCVVVSVLVFIPAAESTLENRVSYLEEEIPKEISTLKRELFMLKKSANKNATPGSVSGQDVPDKLAERVEQMERKVDDFLTKQQKDHFSLRTGFQVMKQFTHDQLNELKALSTNKAENITFHDKLSEVTRRIENEENERGELKREMEDDIKSVISALDKKVTQLKAELEKMVQEKQNVGVLLPPCPDEWTLMDRKCYLYNTDDHLDWHAATVKCSMVGGKLAEPETAAEMQAVLRFVGDNVWLGGTDATEEGAWIWDSSQKTASHLTWESGQPNNHGDNQHCLEVYDHQLNDDNCLTQNYYICERKAS